MAEKGAPRAANNPNTTQLRSAPMNLRSAMQKYAVGGGVGSPPPSASDINSFVQANIGNPQAIMQAAQQYGVSMDDLANATGYSSSQINDYFGNAGLGSMGTRPAGNAGLGAMGTRPAPVVEGSGFLNQTPIPPVMPNEGLNEPEYPGAQEYGLDDSDPVSLGVMNTPQTTEESLSPYLPRFTPPAVSEESLSPYLPKFTPPNSTIPPELLKMMQERGDPFGSQITQQDQQEKIMKLLQSLGMK
jgi:hypothetical protein